MQTEMKERPSQENQAERTPVYSPQMTDAEIAALIARLDANREARTHGQPNVTDSVQIVRTMRQQRSRALMRRATDARRG